MYDDAVVRMLAANATLADVVRLECEFKEKWPGGPVAFYPAAIFPRLVAQSGVFTIHPRPEPAHRLLDISGRTPSVLGRYMIPSASKPTLRNTLSNLGVVDRVLFPDLDALSRTITKKFLSVHLHRAALPKLTHSEQT